MQNGPVADAPRGNWVDAFAPGWLKPYARLARWDRPIGFWLLFWPCAFAIALAALAEPARPYYWLGLIEMFIGAIAMRGAGCALNDIVDADIDAKVERTRSRPIPSGQISKRAAAVFLALQALVGLVVLLQFNALTIYFGLASVVLIAIYPFMKRITWWPQLFLGLAFSWGALVGWTATTGALAAAPFWLYAGCILWVIGYDTIYALQDVEDDALVGVRSTARLFGERSGLAVALFYAGALICWTVAAVLAGAGWVFGAALVVPGALLFWQVLTLDVAARGNALARFKLNHWVGVALTLAVIAEWLI